MGKESLFSPEHTVLKDLFLQNVYECLPVYHMHAVLEEARRGCWIPPEIQVAVMCVGARNQTWSSARTASACELSLLPQGIGVCSSVSEWKESPDACPNLSEKERTLVASRFSLP